MTRFCKLLVANRGEIAVRIIRSARDLGYATVAVFSDADAGAPHVRAADEAVRLGPAPASESYLSIDRLLDAAARTHADALHPGYGFLAENGDLAKRCAEAGVTFVGPPESAIRLMGDKVQAKRRMIEAQVPTAPGYHGDDQSDARLRSEADALGVPLLVKAVAGGGGRGMRVVRELSALADALATARSEATNAFGNGDLFLERLIESARHIEIQVFADEHGNVVHLGERECSAQRRHQKVIEEAPSAVVTPHLRAQMGEAAVAAARAIDYVGAGTVEFLLDDDGHFYFLEMNTRLQVEHPVTELVTGLDLVAWQLQVAAGQPLPLTQDEVSLRGHAIEARLYAEDPWAGFLPQVGRVLAWRPAGGAGVRIDAGIASGQTISPYYDPMVAKVIAHGPDREVARRRLVAALRRSVLLGPTTNRRFLIDILQDESFASANIKTDTLDRLELRRPEPTSAAWAVAAVLCSRGGTSSFDDEGWRPTSAAAWPVTLAQGETRRTSWVESTGRRRYRVRHDVESPEAHEVVVLEQTAGDVELEIDGIRHNVVAVVTDNGVHVDLEGTAFAFEEPSVAAAAADEASDGEVRAPMGGRVVRVEVAAGDAVDRGQCVAVVEAMKLEHRVTAPASGTVASVTVAAGDQVAARQILATLEIADAAASQKESPT